MISAYQALPYHVSLNMSCQESIEQLHDDLNESSISEKQTPLMKLSRSEAFSISGMREWVG